ncbi:hypothetical protein [Pseudomonas rubra]|uniref:Uncharacterized protein n=1 Tax=Pseudomonas rubra TaxID=2942627 RepID=A0ABT5PE14_9PSED|nr:hypothetical protein [Pseudomonas rubra]MDD1016554.1 hypothetical protein [Pseudomonas rubra]MDD1039151.1 hypothetical protein [Pseudomonas rubra]MDD1157977.1 hypothetical protein [Pseudomonas rubra]
MSKKRLTAALACLCLFAGSSALAWTKENGRVKLRPEEISHCETLALDAAAIMVARQWNLPVSYMDEDAIPVQAREQARHQLSDDVLNHPVRAGEAEKIEALEAFVAASRRKCILDYIDSVPPTAIN